jgi:two-component system nitrate/nitrite response regulator NarL
MERIKIFIVDDHKLFVEGISSLLSYGSDFEVVGFSLSGHEVLRIMDQIVADVFLIDINMPEISGIELTRQLRKKKPDAKVLALTMYDSIEYVEKMIKSGAIGYILKTASLQELSTAIRTVAQGRRFFGEDMQEMLFNRIGNGGMENNPTTPSVNEKASLTKREIEILSLIGKEFTTQQIAAKLFISERTVETHRKNIFSKTRAKSVIGLSRYAIKHGYINFE